MGPLDEAAIFDQAYQIETPEARLLYIQQACAGNRVLLARLQALLRIYDRDPNFLESPAEELQGISHMVISEGIGSQIGPYKLLELIGEGGFGIVFMAEQRQPVPRAVALKILKPGMDTRQVIARFEVERQALALMDHPNIAKVLDAGTTGQPANSSFGRDPTRSAEITESSALPARWRLNSVRPFFVMELVKGIPITQYCDKHRLTLRERLALFIPVCQAIQHAHQKGIIHRDLKPRNVLVADYDGRAVPKVIDFGVAKALGHQLSEQTLTTNLGDIIGTLEYMSPEQADFEARDIDTRADIYSLGVLLYELLTGTTPLTKERLKQVSVTELLRLIREEEPPRPSRRVTYEGKSSASVAAKRKLEPALLTRELRGELDWIVLKALEKDRDRRYTTANGLARDLERFLRDETVEACPPSAGYRLRKFVGKNRKILVIAAAFIILLTAGTLVSLWQAVRATRAEHASNEQRDLAEAETKRSRQNLYDAHMRLAQSAWEEGRGKHVLDLLDQYRLPAGNEDLRNFEWHYLHRQIDSALRTFTGHKDLVWSPVFSPDGKRLATASADGTVKIWDVDKGSAIWTLEGHKGHDVRLAFSSDGKQLAAASFDGAIKIWDAASGNLLRALTGHASAVATVGFCPQRERGTFLLASASSDGQVSLWDTNAGRLIQTFKAHAGPVSTVAITPDGKSLATGGEDKSSFLMKIWDLATARQTLRLEGHTKGVVSVAFSPDGKQLASASIDRTVRIWNIASPATGDLASSRPPLILKGHTDRVFGVAFSHDGKRVASASVDQTIRTWNSTTGEEESVLKGHTNWISSLAFSPDGKRLASASYDRTVKLWDISSGGETAMVIEDRSRVKSVAYSPDGKLLASAGEDPRIKIWDQASGRPRLILSGHSGEVPGIAFSSDGKCLASGSYDKTVRIWDTASGREICPPLKGPTAGVVTVAFSPNGSLLAAGYMDKTVRVWDLTSRRETLKLKGRSKEPWSVAFSPDGKLLASPGDDRTINLWDVASGQVVHTLRGHTGDVNCVAFSPDGNRLASGSTDMTVRIWDAVTGQQLGEEFTGHVSDVFCVAFSPDGKRLASGGASVDKTVKIWDLATGQETLTLKGPALGIPSVAFNPDGLRLAAASYDDTVRVWDARPWTPELRIEQEARNLINSLYASTRQKAEVIRRIEQDPALTAEVRQEALEMTKRWLEDVR